jgi:hypothetical protein
MQAALILIRRRGRMDFLSVDVSMMMIIWTAVGGGDSIRVLSINLTDSSSPYICVALHESRAAVQ